MRITRRQYSVQLRTWTQHQRRIQVKDWTSGPVGFALLFHHVLKCLSPIFKQSPALGYPRIYPRHGKNLCQGFYIRLPVFLHGVIGNKWFEGES